MNIEIPNYEVVKNLGWRRREAGMGGDIYIQIYTSVSTRPSTSRPLLAAYAVQAERLRGLRRAHVPVQPHVHAYIDYNSKGEIANLDNYLKIISCASYLPAISHVCIRSTGKPEPTIPPLPTQILQWSGQNVHIFWQPLMTIVASVGKDAEAPAAAILRCGRQPGRRGR